MVIKSCFSLACCWWPLWSKLSMPRKHLLQAILSRTASGERQELTRNEVRQHWDWLTLGYPMAHRRTSSHQICCYGEERSFLLRKGPMLRKCFSNFSLQRIRQHSSAGQQHPTTAAWGVRSSQRDLDDSSTFTFQLSCLELGRATGYKESAANRRCQNSLPTLW